MTDDRGRQSAVRTSSPNRWAFFAAAGIPCVALLVFCGVGIHEYWLISTQQIVVLPALTPGTTSAPGVPAARLVPLILGSGVLAGLFAYAFLRGSRRALAGAYLAVVVVIGFAVVRRMFW